MPNFSLTITDKEAAKDLTLGVTAHNLNSIIQCHPAPSGAGGTRKKIQAAIVNPGVPVPQ